MKTIVMLMRAESTSFPSLQLKLESLSQLYLGGRKYSDLLHADLKAIAENLLFTDLPFPKTMADAFAQLNTICPDWKRNQRIIILDASIYFLDRTEFTRKIRNLAEATENMVLTDGMSFILGFDPQRLPADDERTITITEDTINLQSHQEILELEKLITKPRSFNRLVKTNNYVEKWTQHLAKGKAEYAFLKNLPESVRCFFPQVGSSREEAAQFMYEIEFFPYSDVSRLFLHQSISADGFRKILRRIQEYLQQAPKKIVSAQEYQLALRHLTINKTQKRIRQILDVDKNQVISRYTEVIYPGGIEAMVKAVCEATEKEILKTKQCELTFSHGDLCFSNIIFDNSSQSVMKFIDPRGIDTEIAPDCFLPIYYDLAKMSHCIFGLYDFIMAGLSHYTMDSAQMLDLKVNAEVSLDYLESFAQIYKSWLESLKFNFKLVRLIEAHLFLSMTPLHWDNKQAVVSHLLMARKALVAYGAK